MIELPDDPLRRLSTRVLTRYAARRLSHGQSRITVMVDLLFVAAGLALADGADGNEFMGAAALAFHKFVQSLASAKRPQT